MGKRTEIVSAHVIAGTFEGKPYQSGRLVIANYPDGATLPSYISVSKCTAQLATDLVTKCPVKNAVVYFDKYTNIIGVKGV